VAYVRTTNMQTTVINLKSPLFCLRVLSIAHNLVKTCTLQSAKVCVEQWSCVRGVALARSLSVLCAFLRDVSTLSLPLCGGLLFGASEAQSPRRSATDQAMDAVEGEGEGQGSGWSDS
jgi:hypothetical protein